MATSVFCLALLFLPSLIPPSQSVAPTARSEEAAEEFIIDEGPTSHLFSKCVEAQRTVEAVLYSISVSVEERFERFAAREKIDFEWETVSLGDTPSIVNCALEAYDLGVYMFKFDGSCSVALNSSYDPTSEQGCDGAAAEVVYITSRPFNAYNGEVVPFGESRGYLYSSPEGFRYGEGGPLVSEVELPPPATCCTETDGSYCMIRHFVDCEINFYEAQARCDALEVPIASKSFFEDFRPDERELPDGDAMWINAVQVDGVWQWMPGMEEISVSEFYAAPEDGNPCGYLKGLISVPPVLLAGKCNSTIQGVYCYSPDSSLPQCLPSL